MNLWRLCCCILNDEKELRYNLDHMTRLKDEIALLPIQLRLEREDAQESYINSKQKRPANNIQL